MRSALVLPLLAIYAIMSCGFVEMSRIIEVNKDGSGVIYVRELRDPEMVNEGEAIHDAEKLKNIRYGTDVEYIVSTEITAENGWVGYLAKYRFKNIKDLLIFPQSLKNANTADENDPLYNSGWRFELAAAPQPETPEEPAEEAGEAAPEEEAAEPAVAAQPVEFCLNIIPLFLDGGGGGEAPAAEDENFGAPEATQETPEDLELKLMQKNRRYVTYIRLPGALDAERSIVLDGEKQVPLSEEYQIKSRVNTILLNDEQFDLIWAKPAARSKIGYDIEPYFIEVVGPKDTPGYRTLEKMVKIYIK